MIDYFLTRDDLLSKRILDSSVITQTNHKPYNVKIIQAGNYLDFYSYRYYKFLKRKKTSKLYDTFIYRPDVSRETLTPKKKHRKQHKIITQDNRNRTVYTLKQLIKGNEDQFKSFITLTFADIKDITQAHKHFNIWRTKVKSIHPHFLYICVPEYQKRGAIHYHLLTNLQLNSPIIPLQPTLTTYSIKSKQYLTHNYYDLKYWRYGFSSALPLTDINDIANYLSKYLFKNFDNRFFGYRKFYTSQKITRPQTTFVNTSDLIEFKSIINFDMTEYNKNYESFYTDHKHLNKKLKELNITGIKPDDFIKSTHLQVIKYTEYKKDNTQNQAI